MSNGTEACRILMGMALALPAPLAAQGAPAAPGHDPNQKVCEVQPQVGSRLGGKKVCLTRAEWAARKAADRESVENLQRIGNMPCIPTAGASAPGGATTC
jgi:hypothetical protein